MNRIMTCIVALCFSTISLGAGFDPADLEAKSQVLAVNAAFEAAWNRGDLDALMAFWAADGEYVNAGNGYWWRGKEEMRKGWSVILAYKNTVRTVDTSFRLIAADTAILTQRLVVSVPAAQGHPALTAQGIGSAVYVKRDGKWLIVFGQSTPVVEPPAPRP